MKHAKFKPSDVCLCGQMPTVLFEFKGGHNEVVTVKCGNNSDKCTPPTLGMETVEDAIKVWRAHNAIRKSET